MQETDNALSMDTLASLCKRRGFIFSSSEIYGGINGFWDYGPLGAELKRNIRDVWWRDLVRNRDNVVGLDASIVMHPRVWEASGHLAGFADPMVDCRVCKRRHKADNLCEKQGRKLIKTETGHRLPEGVRCACGSDDLTEPRAFHLMFKTFVGPVEDESAVAYLRPETAQGIFADFGNVLATSRQKTPFGIAQIGKAFRNEINPRNYTFRSREFEQMEIEFFIKPDEAVEAVAGRVARWTDDADLTAPQPDWGWELWHRYWVAQRAKFYASIGLGADTIEYYWQTPEELAHYAKACVDIQFKFPFGAQELEGIAARGDYDLVQHQAFSGKSLEYFDEELKAACAGWSDERKHALVTRKIAEQQARGACGMSVDQVRAWCGRLFDGFYVPHVIEPSAGVDRIALALLCNAYREEWIPAKADESGPKPPVIHGWFGRPPPAGYDVRGVLRFHPRIAPVKVAVFPLLKNKPDLVAKARAIFEDLRSVWQCFFDTAGAIGRRYRRQDEIGTPFAVTVDFQTLQDNTVTLRDRDTMEQVRLPADRLTATLTEKLS
ncbi:MAG: glycine--tRNA ligase [Verrucomicrobiota bacterium]|nr:glycine--tRNA ligase [Verrucomicrobiota bacterium]